MTFFVPAPVSLSLALVLVATGTWVGCGADPSAVIDGDGDAIDAGPKDADTSMDVVDGGSASGDAGIAVSDAGGGTLDAGGGTLDAGGGMLDGGSALDAGGGITTACSVGPGQALWRLSFPSNQGGYATVEEWDNGCEYSLADQACSLSGEPHSFANFGPGVLFNSSTDYFRVRFSQATLYLTAHAEGSGIPHAVLESPIYGSLSFAPTVPISTHRTYAVDWSDFLSPTDSPSLTAVTLRSMPVGLAVSEIELCVE